MDTIKFVTASFSYGWFSCTRSVVCSPSSRLSSDHDVELEEREAACHSMGTYLDKMSNFSSLDEDEEVGSILDFPMKN
jgi:hypothetical protein